MSASFLSPLAVGQVVTDETSIEQWRTVFIIASIIGGATYVVYQIFATAEVQPWNAPRPVNDQLEEESEILKNANEDINIIPKP
ncbi:vesicular glutamate transporter 2.2 isoform X2 [Scaptodrosophila lebanonensis]|nr:vesicular glutamate transporter 2.2 isoform X2 [Scaptodrosophila lebanonensis]